MNEALALPPSPPRIRRLALTILVLAPFFFGLLALYLGQDANWDLRNYHWYNAYAFLNGRYGFDMLPSQTPYFYNPLLDVPFYLLATHIHAKTAGFILGWVQGLNFILLFMLSHATLTIANPRQKTLVCAALAALGMIGGGGIAMLGTTFYDNITSLGIFLSALLVVRSLDQLLKLPSREALLRAFIFGVPAGFVIGLKLPCIVFGTGLCFAFFGVSGPFRRRFMLSFIFGLGILAGIAITYGYWGWFLGHHFSNPMFPYFNDFFKSPLAPLSSARDVQFLPRSAHDFLLFPFIFTDSPFRTGEIPWRDWRILILYVLLPLALLARLGFGRSKQNSDALARPSAARYLLWAAVISYFLWALMFAIYRYLVPLEMLAPLLIVLAIGMLPLKLQTRGLIAAFILIVIAASIQGGNWSRRASWSDYFIETGVPALGKTSDLMILMAGFDPYSHVIPQFPPDIAFVRIQSNFTSPDQNKGMNAVLHARVEAHKGRYMLLIAGWQKKQAAEALGYYHLALAPGPCQTVVDHLYGDTPLDLCQVTRLNQ